MGCVLFIKEISFWKCASHVVSKWLVNIGLLIRAAWWFTALCFLFRKTFKFRSCYCLLLPWLYYAMLKWLILHSSFIFIFLHKFIKTTHDNQYSLTHKLSVSKILFCHWSVKCKSIWRYSWSYCSSLQILRETTDYNLAHRAAHTMCYSMCLTCGNSLDLLQS